MIKSRFTPFILVLLLLISLLGYTFYQSKHCSVYASIEVGLSFVTVENGNKIKICYPQLVLKSLSHGLPYKIKIYKDGYLVKNQFLNFSFTERLDDGKQHDYLVDVVGIGQKRLLLSDLVVLFGNTDENIVSVNWEGGRPDPTDMYHYIKVVGLEKLKYAVRKNPFEGSSEIKSVQISVIPNTFNIVGLTIYPKDKNIKSLTFPGLKNPYLLIKYDAAFSANSFLWDDAFTSWFSINQNPEIVKNTLDFWYSLQINDGENKGLIPREVRIVNYINSNNQDVLSNEINPVSMHPLSSDQLTNPYILSRVEIELYKKTIDSGRLKNVTNYSIDYFNWIESHRKENKFIGRVGEFCPIYKSSNFGSGMDNSPRGGDIPSQYGWFDLAAQQVALAGDISEIAKITKDNETYKKFSKIHDSLKREVQMCYFDNDQSFWFDIRPDGGLDVNNPTAAGLWGIYASLASKTDLSRVVNDWILNPSKFGGFPPIPSLPRDHTLFNKDGEYWRGGGWPPLWWITIYGLKENGFNIEADNIFSDVFKTFQQTFEKQGSVFEFYSPTVDVDSKAMFGKFGDYSARSDMFGWGKLPLMYHSF